MWKHSDIEKLKKSGKIRGFQAGKKLVKKMPASKSAALAWLDRELKTWAKENCWFLHTEFRFDKVRKFRFDWALFSPYDKVAIEFEGGIFLKKSGHNTATHYTKDTEKYNLATVLGWKVLRYTALNYKNVIEDLNKLLKM